MTRFKIDLLQGESRLIVASTLLLTTMFNSSLQCQAADRGATGAVPPSMVQQSQDPAIRLRQARTKFRSASLVLYADKELKLPTAYGTLVCAPNTAAYIYQSPQSLTIYALDAKGKKDIQMLVEDKSLSVSPGHQLVLTDIPDATFRDVVAKLGILYRTPKSAGKIGNVQAFDAEFMIEVAAQQIPEIRSLSTSDDPEKRNMLRRILKNAALLQSDAKREFVDRIRLPSAEIAVGAVESAESDKGNSNAANSNAKDSLAAKGTFLQGKVDVLENLKGRTIDMTIASKDGNFPSDQEVRWVKQKDNDWTALESRDTATNQTSAIFTCVQDCVIKTDLAAIECKPGSIVFVDNKPADVTICTLDTHGMKDVVVHLPTGHFKKIPPGSAIFLHKRIGNLHFSPAPMIGYRGWWHTMLGELDVYGADFSLANAMYKIEPLRAMTRSSDPKEHAKALSILKNFAIMAQIDP